jgi:hypothetical protein
MTRNGFDNSTNPNYRQIRHCMRELGRDGDAIQHAANGLGPPGDFARSDFFVSIALPDAHPKSPSAAENGGCGDYALTNITESWRM